MGKIKKTKKMIRAKQEKKNLHAKYICGIVLSVSLVCVVLSAYNHETFVSQFAFAGTVTSTVLSMIAIWISMSREKSAMKIRNKITTSANRLKKATKRAKTVNVSQEETMARQLTQLEDVQKKLSLLLDRASEPKTETAILRQEPVKIKESPCEPVKQPPNADQLWSIFENTYGWIQEDEQNGQSQQIFCKMLQTLIHYRQSQNTYTFSDVLSQLGTSGVKTSNWLTTIYTHWGVLNALTAAGILDDPDTLQKIKEKTQILS